MLKTSDLRGLAEDELLEKINELKKSLMNYRFQLKTGKLETQSNVSATRKDIARIMTVLSEKKRENQEKAKG